MMLVKAGGNRMAIPAPPHSFSWHRGHQARLLGWTDDGERIWDDGDDDTVTTMETVPAAPGWYTIRWRVGASGEEHVFKHAIVAWQIEHASGTSDGRADHGYTTTALTCDDEGSSTTPCAVLGPDGIVYHFQERPMPYADWVAAQREKMKLKTKAPA
jgi:hypothetical protein